MGRLASLQTAGEAMVQRAVKLQRDNLCGYIEQVAVDDTGLIWITGWLRNVTAIEMPVIIATDQKFAGGMALTLFTRADLGGDASGFVAAIRSDWRPRAGGEFLIVVSETAFIQSVATPKIISKRDFADHFNHNKPNCHGGNCDALLHLLDHPDSWEPTDGLTGNQVRTTLEEVFGLPNFGCIVTGWVLSPLRPIKAFGLRFGSTVCAMTKRVFPSAPVPNWRRSAMAAIFCRQVAVSPSSSGA